MQTIEKRGGVTTNELRNEYPTGVRQRLACLYSVFSYRMSYSNGKQHRSQIKNIANENTP